MKKKFKAPAYFVVKLPRRDDPNFTYVAENKYPSHPGEVGKVLIKHGYTPNHKAGHSYFRFGDKMLNRHDTVNEMIKYGWNKKDARAAAFYVFDRRFNMSFDGMEQHSPEHVRPSTIRKYLALLSALDKVRAKYGMEEKK